MQFNDTLTNLVQTCIKNGIIPMLLGEPGIGKSSWLTDLARINHTKCFTLACNQLADKADLTGARLIPADPSDPSKGYKQVFYPHAVIADANEYAISHPREEPILFLDELNRTTPDVTSELLSIPTMRMIGNTKLANNLRIVIAGNDKGNITALDEASISRFMLVHVEPDVNTFIAIHSDLNEYIKTVLTAHPDTLFCKKLTIQIKNDNDDDNDSNYAIEDIITDGDGMQQITTPRTLEMLSKYLNSLSQNEYLTMLSTTYKRADDGSDTCMLEEIIEGFTGRTNFSTYLLAVIAEQATKMSSKTASAKPAVGKPMCYDEMKSKTSMSDLNDFIDTMSDADKSGCLVYAMFEKTDNDAYIRALSNKTITLTPEDMNALMIASATGELDNQNVEVFNKTKTDLSTKLSVILNIGG